MNSSPRTPYDEIRYPAWSFEYTHPNRLATIAALYGMTPAPISNCRVLELGCGVGGNIIPMAYQNPESQFVGIDLSGDAIAAGQARVAALALKNITLFHLNILNVDDQFGHFDYIIAHGVYSWVPRQVRQKIFAISKQLLSPHGVSYVSYNAHPYSHMRNMARDVMLFHTRHLTDAKEVVDQARAITQFIAEASPADSAYGNAMRSQKERLDRMYNEVLFHDDLNAAAEAFLLHRVIEDAQEFGLQYLGDVDFARQDLTGYPDHVRSTLESFPLEMMGVRDQYQDFIDGAGFRRTLLCHEDLKLTRRVTDDFVKRFYLSAPANKASVEAPTALAKAAFRCLGEVWPRSLDFEELTDRVCDRLKDEQAQSSAREGLTSQVAAAVRRGDIVFRFERPNIVTTLSERPKVSDVARLQAEAGEAVTNLRHLLVRIDNEMSRRFLSMVDGTRTIDELQFVVDRLNDSMPEGAPESPAVESLLAKLVEAALLVG